MQQHGATAGEEPLHERGTGRRRRARAERTTESRLDVVGRPRAAVVQQAGGPSLHEAVAAPLLRQHLEHARQLGPPRRVVEHGQGALHRTLRGELLGKPVRLTEIAPGAVETEFSLVRFDGDAERADAVYQGITPLVAEDVAEVIGFVASRPPHVDLDQIVMRPRDQAPYSRFNRRPQ